MKMDTIMGTLSGSGKPRRLTRYTPAKVEIGGFPAILFDPQQGEIRILHTEVLGRDGMDFVKRAIKDVQARMEAIDAAVASERHG